jgi:hypothetical protein
MDCFWKSALTVFVGCLLFSLSALPQDPSQPALPPKLPVFADLSVIGSDGVYYRLSTRPPSPLSDIPGKVPFPAISRLEGFNLDPNSHGPFEVLQLPGFGTNLAIGKDDRLFLVLSLSDPTILTDSSLLKLPEMPAKSKLYIVPTPFPAQAVLGSPGRLQGEPNASAGSPALTEVVKVDLDGIGRSLKVKDVGGQEYLYVVTTQFSLSAPLSLSGSGPPITVNPSSKLVILDSDGKKIKESALD